MNSKKLNVFLYFSMIYNLLIAILLYSMMSNHMPPIYHEIIFLLAATNIFAIILIKFNKPKLGIFWLFLFFFLSLFLHFKYSMMGWTMNMLPIDILSVIIKNLSFFVLLVFFRKQIFKKEKND